MEGLRGGAQKILMTKETVLQPQERAHSHLLLMVRVRTAYVAVPDGAGIAVL